MLALASVWRCSIVPSHLAKNQGLLTRTNCLITVYTMVEHALFQRENISY